jgi:methyl-accepting chemotaxis protein
VSLQAGQITSAIESQRKKSEEIVEFTRKIQTTTAELIASAADMNEGITSLSNDAARLTDELKKFTTDADGARLHPSSTAGATPAN